MIDVRAPGADELRAFVDAMTGPFGFDLPDEEGPREDLLDRMEKLYEPGRARCAYDGDRIVGTLGVFSFDMSVPGGAVPVAGTTQVTVQVTHRRRGLLRRMMSAHLEEAIENGDAAAALWASDSAIYGRFGFGMAAANATIELDRRHVDFHRLAPVPAPVELVDVDDLQAPARDVYERVRQEVPGMMSRREAWWDHTLSDQPWSRGGASKARYAVAFEDDRAVGWTKYRVKDSAGEDDGHPRQDVIVSQLFAHTPGGWAGLWQHVLSHDFGFVIRGRLRPIDDPLLSLLRAPRRAKTLVNDGLWVRVLDVERFFGARAYGADGSVAFEVADPMGLAGGTYVLEADGGAGTVRRGAEADIHLDIEDLGAMSLGGVSAVALAAAGRITGDPDQIRLLDRVLHHPRAPWCPEVF